MKSQERSSAAFQEICRLLLESTGIDFRSYKQTTIRRRLQRRLSLNRLRDVKSYLAYVRKHPEELEGLYQDFLINVTEFFREPRVFELIKKSVLPVLLKNRSERSPLRIWVPACSSGEEVYSLAITVREFLDGRSLSVPMQIFSTDVSEAMLEKARSAVYPKEKLKGVKPEYIRKYFVEENGFYRVCKEIRESCVFARQNVMNDPPFSKVDLISCRNLFIYLEPEQQNHILSTFHFALNPGGFLILGSSESVTQKQDLFKLVDKANKFYTKKQVTGLAQPPMHISHILPKREILPSGFLAQAHVLEKLQKEMEHLLLEKYPIFTAFKRRKPAKSRSRAGKSSKTSLKKESPEVSQLRQELVAMNEYLQTMVEEHEASTEELRSANEEILSSNEELQSTNEELESAKEELQAANEELTSINEELQKRNTQLKDSMERLRISEERFRLLVSGVKDYAIFMLDPKGYIASWNAGAQRIKGYSAEEVIGKHFSIFYTEDGKRLGLPKKELETALRDGKYMEQGWRVRKDGTVFFADVVLTTVRDEEGVVRGFAKITRDMTEMREVLSRLKASEERFRLLVSGVKDYAIFLLDPKGYIASWNAGAQKIKGYSADDVIGRHFSIFYPEEEKRRGKPEWELETATREGSYSEEGWRLRKDGSLFWADVLITAIKDDQGTVRGFAKVTRDLTERKLASQAIQAAQDELEKRVQERTAELAKANEDLRRANRIKSEFTATVSHELRTPLATIKEGVEIVLSGTEGPLNHDQTESLQIVQRNVDRLARLVNSVLDLQKMESGEIDYQMEVCDIDPIVRGAVEDFVPMADKKGLNLVYKSGRPLPSVYLDKDKIIQVIANLINNAIRFSDSGTIEVSTEVQGDSVRVAVKDHGVGIHEEDKPKLFKSFSQLTRAEGRKTGGAGLGLVISKKIIVDHQGMIDFVSAYGKGATFFFILPVSR